MKAIRGPVAVTVGEYDEAIKLEHTKQMASLIPGSTLILLPKLSHFAYGRIRKPSMPQS